MQPVLRRRTGLAREHPHQRSNPNKFSDPKRIDDRLRVLFLGLVGGCDEADGTRRSRERFEALGDRSCQSRLIIGAGRYRSITGG